MSQLTQLDIGFVGGGMMAEAMIGGLLKAGTTTADRIVVSEPTDARRKYMAEKYKVKVTESNDEAVNGAEVVVFAVKPQVLMSVLSKLGTPETMPLFVSIVAGMTIDKYLEGLKTYISPSGVSSQRAQVPWRIARVMPNTPSLVGCGASCYVLSGTCRDRDAQLVEAVMGACGIVERLEKESLLDAVTGLSGSGPAYVYLLIEALSDGGVRQGLPRDMATRLAAQTVMGAGKMVMDTGKHTGQLKDAVTSPGGTTIAGVHALESGAFRGTIINAVEAATKRSQELGRL